MISVSSAAFQLEDGDGENPDSEGPAAGRTAGQPQRTGSPAGGTVSRAEHQQGPWQRQSKSNSF